MLARPDQPAWVQLILTVLPLLLAGGLVWTILHLVGDLTYEVRRDRSKVHRAAQLLPPDEQPDVLDFAGPVRLQRQRVKGWRTPTEAVSICRGTDWGNPWRVGDLVALPGFDGSIRVTRELAVALFAAYVTERGWVEQMTEELAGRDLVCWCKIGTPCHADWILETVNQSTLIFNFTTHDVTDTPAFVHKHLTHMVRRI